MKRIKRLCIPVLLGVVLIVAVVGVVTARPNARPQAQAWRVLSVGVHACLPGTDRNVWDHTAFSVMCNSGTCVFVCPVDFPAAGEQAVGAVNVKRFTMYAWINDTLSVGGVWADLCKYYPPTGADRTMAHVETYSDSGAVQTVMDTGIGYNPVYRVQSPYIWVWVDTGVSLASIQLSGFYIHYTWL